MMHFTKAQFELIQKEIRLLEEVCAFYANDEDRYIAGKGEAYGSIPTGVGIKARSARQRFLDRESAQPVIDDVT